VAIAAALGCVAMLACRAAAGREWFDLDDKALRTFDFEGLGLPASAAQLKKDFPKVQHDAQAVDGEVGLACYSVRDLKNVDLARFYFCDDKLYQVEIEYRLARVEKMGGMQTLLRKLIDTWGPADHAGQSRWTWQRPAYMRRADFYSWADSAQLVITDTTLMPVVAERVGRAEGRRRVKLGF